MQIKLTYVGKPDALVPRMLLWFISFMPILIRMKALVNQSEIKAYLIDDIERNGYCFTDGVGRISLGLAKKIALANGIRIDKDV